MSKIKILPEILSNKIAAGEVVERPASVVKELVENAVDAGSSRITIEIGQGGRSMIRVSDNGLGMAHDDALLAIERYATSKIYSDPDLHAIATLGFRGEALPSIAAVSKFTLTTNDGQSNAATRIYVEGGKIRQVDETGAPPGTMISADQLFFNTPARRKFLKTVNTEMGHIADVVSSLALARKDIQFRLFHNDRMVKNWPAVNDPVDRMVDVLGREFRSGLYPVSLAGAYLSINGWISDPAITRRTSQKIYIYVNGRFIRNRGIYYAILDGYKGRLMKGRYPVGVLFLSLPPAEVDVNVHPTKHEVRFSNQRGLFQAIRTAVAQALQSPGWQPAQPTQSPRIEESVVFPEKKSSSSSQSEEPVASPPSEAPGKPKAPLKRGSSIIKTEPAGHGDMETKGPGETEKLSDTSRPETPPGEQARLWQQPEFSRLSVIGQFHNTYILCESESVLYVIDQHAAHERIVYEKLLRQRREASVQPSQSFLIPETIELNYRESAVINEMIPDLVHMGIAIEPFGGNTFIVKSLPSILSGESAGPLITEIAETVADSGYAPGLEETIEQCLILMACHGAIRANHYLSEKEIQALLKQLDQCENPYHCPHGRPTLIQWPIESLEKRFRRTL
ncbi:MAG: DNA mismatch repair endonuclease MutL [Desulfobacterales bacterium]|nr:DNA mismatch repair endonuclease MutL [Desulfobacterales bacterium]